MDFAARVDRQAGRYFDDVLPRFIARFFKGEGRELLWHLMDAHDRKDLSAVEGVQAGRGARKRAEFVEASCPLELEPALPGAAPMAPAGLVLGLFQHSTREVRNVFAGSHPISHERRVTLFEASFIAAGWDEATVDREIFWTIFHEYIHYFESHLLNREQPLASRERGQWLERPSLEDVKRQDRRAGVRRLILMSAGLAVIAGLVALMIARAPRPPREESVQVVTVEERRAAEARLAEERVAAAQRSRALVARVELAATEGADPLVATLVVGERPLCDTAVHDESCERFSRGLKADPTVAGAPPLPAGVTRTMVWVKPNPDVFPMRVVGLAWTADGGVSRVELTAD